MSRCSPLMFGETTDGNQGHEEVVFVWCIKMSTPNFLGNATSQFVNCWLAIAKGPFFDYIYIPWPKLAVVTWRTRSCKFLVHPNSMWGIWMDWIGWMVIIIFPFDASTLLVKTGKLPLDRLFSSVFQLKKSLPALFAAGCDHSWSLDSLVALLLCGRPDNFPAFWIFFHVSFGPSLMPWVFSGCLLNKKIKQTKWPQELGLPTGLSNRDFVFRSLFWCQACFMSHRKDCQMFSGWTTNHLCCAGKGGTDSSSAIRWTSLVLKSAKRLIRSWQF